MSVVSNPMEEMQVELGGVTLHKKEDFEQIIAVEKALIHEKYRESPDALHNDVGESCWRMSMNATMATDVKDTIQQT